MSAGPPSVARLGRVRRGEAPRPAGHSEGGASMTPIVQVRPGTQRQQARIASSALALMESARHGLAAAEDEVSPGARYVSAHLAALRAAAAVVAARAEPAGGRRRRPQSVWELL